MAELDSDAVNINLFVSECFGHGLIDSGCTSCVAGSVWMSSYIDSLRESDKSLVESCTSEKKYRFGDGQEVSVQKRINIPVYSGQTRAILSVDVVSASIPLLLSNQSLKKGNATIDFESRKMTILNQTVDLVEISTGHLLVPLCLPSVYTNVMLTSKLTNSDSSDEPESL